MVSSSLSSVLAVILLLAQSALAVEYCGCSRKLLADNLENAYGIWAIRGQETSPAVCMAACEAYANQGCNFAAFAPIDKDDGCYLAHLDYLRNGELIDLGHSDTVSKGKCSDFGIDTTVTTACVDYDYIPDGGSQPTLRARKARLKEDKIKSAALAAGVY